MSITIRNPVIERRIRNAKAAMFAHSTRLGTASAALEYLALLGLEQFERDAENYHVPLNAGTNERDPGLRFTPPKATGPLGASDSRARPGGLRGGAA